MIFNIINFNDKPELEIRQPGTPARRIRRDMRARYYKPLCLLVTLDAMEDGELEWSNIKPKIIINRFKYILENFDAGKSIDMGWMPFWHLSPLDKIWTCYKNKLIVRRTDFPSEGKPKSKQQLLKAVNYASVNEDFKECFTDSLQRAEFQQLLIELLSRENDLISRQIAYYYQQHTYSIRPHDATGQGKVDDEQIRIAIELEAMRRTRKQLEKEGWKVIDRSSSCPYDFECSKGSIIKFVEVKGTQHEGERITLTYNEVQHALSNRDNMMLSILSNVEIEYLHQNEIRIKGGRLKIINPWKIKESKLKPKDYYYDVT